MGRQGDDLLCRRADHGREIHHLPGQQPEAGNYYFFCIVHPNMNGTVEAIPETGSGGANGAPPSDRRRPPLRLDAPQPARAGDGDSPDCSSSRGLVRLEPMQRHTHTLDRRRPQPTARQAAPAISLPSLDGSGTFNLSDYKGRPVIVNFWASWCVPCRQEFPLFKEARTEHAADGLEILGVVHADSADSAQRFAADQGATWPLLMDANDAAWQAYDMSVMPTSFYIDRQGMVRAVSYGPPPSGTLEEQLTKIL
jgi:cytochrome c biogenesis protein CcmG/thiol:disulfide interchange protein DsbE